MPVLAVGSAMNSQQQWHLRARHISHGTRKQAMDFGAVLALEAHILGRRDVELPEQRVVLVGELNQVVSFQAVNLPWFGITAGYYGRMPSAKSPVADHDRG